MMGVARAAIEDDAEALRRAKDAWFGFSRKAQ